MNNNKTDIIDGINNEKYIFMETFKNCLENTIKFIENNYYNNNLINKSIKYKNKWNQLINNFLLVLFNFNNNKDLIIYDDLINKLMIKTRDIYIEIGRETTTKINNRDIIYDDNIKKFIYEHNLIMNCINNYFNLK